jgi:drug/metabolite transporter (DMT)-like permease
VPELNDVRFVLIYRKISRRSMLGIALALLSAALSGLSVVIVGKYNQKSSALNISIVITMVGMAVLLPLAVIANEFSAITLAGFGLFAIGGLLSPGLVRLLYYGGLKRLGTAVNSSIFAVYPLFSLLLAVLLLDETLALVNWVGIFIVVIGVVLVEMSSYSPYGKSRRQFRNFVFPILGGLALGVSMIVRKYALDLCNTPVTGVAIAYTFSLIPFAAMMLLHKSARDGQSLRQDFRLFWIAGIGQAAAWALAFYALSVESAAMVATLLSIEPIFVVLIASFYLGKSERIGSKLIASILITVLGAVLVAL